MEFASTFRPRPIRHVLMDWDGTTTFSRAGWADIMADVYVEHLPRLPDDDDAARRAFALVELSRLNGRPSIHQMAHLGDLIRQRGGVAADADEYQHEFQRRLTEVVGARFARIHAGQRAADDLLVPGARLLLEGLRARGIALTLASGTPLSQVQDEAERLDVTRYFAAIHAPDGLHDRHFSKRQIIADILADEGMDGTALLAFGDGPAEIAETKAVGGVAIAVASDETEIGSGRFDPWKRESLLAAGADAVVADYRDAAGILEAILGE